MNETLAEKLSNKIYEVVKQKGIISLIDVERIFKENGFAYEDRIALCSRNRNLFLWSGWKQEAYEILVMALKKGLHLVDTSAETYLSDENLPDLSILDLPVFDYKNFSNSEKSITEKYWLPVALCMA